MRKWVVVSLGKGKRSAPPYAKRFVLAVFFPLREAF
jgi:hypothetical protein